MESGQRLERSTPTTGGIDFSAYAGIREKRALQGWERKGVDTLSEIIQSNPHFAGTENKREEKAVHLRGGAKKGGPNNRQSKVSYVKV